MKQFKFIAIILLFLLAFKSGAEFYKYSAKSALSQTEKKFTSTETSQVSSSSLLMSKDLDVHFTVKKKIKYRATTSGSSTLKTPYYSKLVHFKIFKNRLIYGIATIYLIQRHTHLHLYQLF